MRFEKKKKTKLRKAKKMLIQLYFLQKRFRVYMYKFKIKKAVFLKILESSLNNINRLITVYCNTLFSI